MQLFKIVIFRKSLLNDVLHKIENLIKLERKIVAGQINGNSNVHNQVRVNSYQCLIPTIYQHIDCF